MIREFCASFVPGLLPVLRKLELAQTEEDAGRILESVLIAFCLLACSFLSYEILKQRGEMPLLFQMFFLIFGVTTSSLLRFSFYRRVSASLFSLVVTLVSFLAAVAIDDAFFFLFKGLNGFHLTIFLFVFLLVVNTLVCLTSRCRPQNLNDAIRGFAEVRKKFVTAILIMLPLVFGFILIDIAFRFEQVRVLTYLATVVYFGLFIKGIRARLPDATPLFLAKRAIKSLMVSIAVAGSGLLVERLVNR